MYSTLSSERMIQTENNCEYYTPHGYCSDRWWNLVLVLQQRTPTVQLEGKRDAWGYRNPNKCVEKLQAIVMVSKVDTGNKAVRNLTSANRLIPLQSKMAQYANVFRLDKKSKEEDDLPRTFEDHVKSVEELIAFLFNHEQEALERTSQRNTNGPDITIPRCTRQSFLI